MLGRETMTILSKKVVLSGAIILPASLVAQRRQTMILLRTPSSSISISARRMMGKWLLLLVVLFSCGGGGGWLLLPNASTVVVAASSSSLWKRRPLKPRAAFFGTSARDVVLDRHHHRQRQQFNVPPLSCYGLMEDGEIYNNNDSPVLHLLTAIRGGAAAQQQQQQDDDDFSDIELDITYQQHHRKQGGEDDENCSSSNNNNNIAGTIKGEFDEEDDDAPSAAAASTTSDTLPVKIRISTGLHSPLLDQHVEFTASSKRTLSSIKQAVSKTMPGRPPISCIQLRYRGRLLLDQEDSVTVNDILSSQDDDDEDDDEDEGENDNKDNEDEDDSKKLSLTCDILPPIDSKFGVEFRNKIVTLSTKEIIEAYCLNMAGMIYGQEERQQFMSLDGWGGGSVDNSLKETNVQEEDDYNENVSTSTVGEDASLNIRKRAAFLQKQLFDSMFTKETKQLVEEEHARVMKKKKNVGGDGVGGEEEEEEVVFGLIHSTARSNAIRSGGAGMSKGGRKASKGGAAMNVKKALQKNLNVNWADTTRNSLLFLFFGYFGGRNSFSRTFLLLSSPLCFILQTRPVKVAMKQLFYTIGEPPGIFLSLLPAPQQAIMSCDYGGVMKGLYGEKMLEGEEWLKMERLEAQVEEENERNCGDFGGRKYYFDDDDNEYDQYDDEPDSDGQ